MVFPRWKLSYRLLKSWGGNESCTTWSTKCSCPHYSVCQGGWFPAGHLDSPQQPQAHLTLGMQLCSPVWSCCPPTWHCPPALGLAFWVHLGRLCVSLKMCCRSRVRYKWSLVNLQIFIKLTLKSSICYSLKKFCVVSSHPPCCLPLLIAQK